MSSFRTSPRLLFCMASAVTAAAMVDPLVERLSNAGAFGAGHFTDRSNLDVIPALTVGCALALAFVTLAAWRQLMHRKYAPPWLREWALDLAPSSIMSLVPAVLSMQLFALFAMETLEQLAVYGHPLGGTVWLGGPVVVSLVLHLAGSVATTLVFSRILLRSARTLADVICLVMRAFIALGEQRSKPRARSSDVTTPRFIEPIIERLKGRAPPHLSALR